MSEYGLSNDVVAGIRRVFASYPQIGKAILYGSRAKGSYHGGSDIDLTFVAAEGHHLDIDLIFRIDEELDELLLPYSFDLSVLVEIDNNNLIDHIERVGVVFYQQ
ncbi:MAG: nucleotidyltransferase domain-containing protein [Endozoicomonas sp.]